MHNFHLKVLASKTRNKTVKIFWKTYTKLFDRKFQKCFLLFLTLKSYWLIGRYISQNYFSWVISNLIGSYVMFFRSILTKADIILRDRSVMLRLNKILNFLCFPLKFPQFTKKVWKFMPCSLKILTSRPPSLESETLALSYLH